MKWKPIETAPNGEAILVYRDNGEMELVSEDDNDFEWTAYDGKRVPGVSKPTHWFALYEIPSPQ